MSDEYRVDLDERRDRYDKTYLFGTLRMFNSVMFVRQDKRGQWHATIRPYIPPKDETDNEGNGEKVDKQDRDYDSAWSK